MTQKQKEKIAKNAASIWCRCFKCDGVVNETNIKCEKDRLATCLQWYNGYRAALLALDNDRLFNNLWKPADGDYLPEIDREVVVFIQNFPDDAGIMKVAIAHRPNPNGWDGRNILTGEVDHYTPKTYDKGGWNIPDVKWWLDLDLPKMQE